MKHDGGSSGEDLNHGMSTILERSGVKRDSSELDQPSVADDLVSPESVEGQGQGQPPPSKKSRVSDDTEEVNDPERSSSVDSEDPGSDNDDYIWKVGDETPDFEIVTTEDRILKVQKSILAERSTFFKNHFESGPADQQDQVRFDGIHPQAMKIILDFIYFGKISHEEAIRRNAGLMFKYAHRFEVQELKNFAENVLVDSVTAENALELYRIAESCEGARLLAKVSDFFKNHADEMSPEEREVLEYEMEIADEEASRDLVNFEHSSGPPDFEILSWSSKFLVHQAVLTQKSPFFENYVTMPGPQSLRTFGTPSEIIKPVLDYLYSGEVKQDDLEKLGSNPDEVFRLVDYWKLQEFKDLFEQSLINRVCAESVFKLWWVARSNGATKLKAKAEDFAAQNPAAFSIGCQKYFDDKRKTLKPEVAKDGDNNNQNESNSDV